ncbi:hypothetical protein [Mycolicibacterium conceptionense]|uniref:hypothetical protein n=1 Tax=Mycolicibacterium conceptionense TaxID=451644 RepID=UPI0002D818DE|nr:hypothetical protein [Mycolicibacterium conceptionense]
MNAPRPHPVWCPNDTRKLAEKAEQVQPKPKLREWLWAPALIFAAILSGLVTAPDAKADGQLSPTEAAYVANYSHIVCQVIADNPSVPGVYGVVAGVADTGKFAAEDAVDVVNASVLVSCAEWWPLLEAAGAQARAAERGVAL